MLVVFLKDNTFITKAKYEKDSEFIAHYGDSYITAHDLYPTEEAVKALLQEMMIPQLSEVTLGRIKEFIETEDVEEVSFEYLLYGAS